MNSEIKEVKSEFITLGMIGMSMTIRDRTVLKSLWPKISELAESIKTDDSRYEMFNNGVRAFEMAIMDFMNG